MEIITVTLFKNITSTKTPFYRGIDVVFDRIKNGKNKELIDKIRSEPDNNIKNELKSQLPSIVFSGTFKERADKAIIKHSGIICLDFDKIVDKDYLLLLKERFSKDIYVYSCFISPSGNGIKVLIKIPIGHEKHKNFFNSLKKYFNEPHFDSGTGDLSRACFESYDPDIYINDNSDIYTKEDDEDLEITNNRYGFEIKLSDNNKIIERLMKWWTNKFPLANGQRNNNLFILASSFNDYGIAQMECEIYFNQFIEKDFTENEIRNIIKSAYQKTVSHGTKFFEDKETYDYIKRATISGVSRNEIASIAKQINKSIDEKTIENISGEAFSDVFWNKTKKGSAIIDNFKFKKFLESNGFFKHYPEGSDSFVFIKQENNLIDNTNPVKIKDYVLNYLLTIDDLSIYQFLTSNPKYFKDEYLNILGSANIAFKSDESKKAYLYFQNYALEVSPDEIKEIDYIDLNGYVWKKQIIKNDYKKVDYHDCIFDRFIKNISSKSKDREMAFKTAIGYLLHSFNSISRTVAIILNDELISENPEGGTGKGIVVNAVSKLKNVAMIDGKNFSFDKSFPYQLVSADTQVIVFDDVKKDFEFQNLFSVITEGITLEKKNKDAIKIPRERSPKVAITTNYSIRGAGNSNERRKWELELSQYYKRNFTPEDEFKHSLYDDWDINEWSKFYCYMISCLQLYLKNGLMEGSFSNIDVRKFISSTHMDFKEWALDGNLPTNVRIKKSEKYDQFISEYPDYKKWLKQKTFTIWIDFYAKYMNLSTTSGKTNGDRWIMIVEDKKNATVQEEENEVKEETPF